MKEPFSLELLTSGNYVTFMERSLPTGAFAPGRNTGIRASNAILDKRMTWAIGAFYGDTDDDGDSNFDDVTNADLTMRLTGLPLHADEDKRLLHLGLSYSHQFRDEGQTTARYRNRPESNLTDVRLVDTGNIDLDSANLVNPEIAFVWGPFSLQGEYYWTKLDAKEAGDPTFQGAYLFGSWFITGEHRPYLTSWVHSAVSSRSTTFTRRQQADSVPGSSVFDGPGSILTTRMSKAERKTILPSASTGIGIRTTVSCSITSMPM